jgi:DNA-binding NarL/FixJ family response regulator
LGTERSKARLIVVEDFVPFRQVFRNALAKCPNWRIICEVSDGAEAVQEATELKPDLILLAIGLPTLNGFKVARQILKLNPESKIIFLTVESSPEIVQEAFSLGARGYVMKARITGDLLAAVKAVLEGKQFVSDGLLPNRRTFGGGLVSGCALVSGSLL